MFGKSQLFTLLSSVNRGVGATPEQRTTILSQIVQLEERNPTPCPSLAREKLDGDWRLLYTTSTELLGIDAVPLLRLGEIYQCLRLEAGQVYNIAEIDGVPGLAGLVTVAANFTVEGDRRLKVQFQRAIFGLQTWINYQNPAQFIEQMGRTSRFLALDFPIQNRTGWIDLTYLDDDLRINRGNEGSIFVLSRCA